VKIVDEVLDDTAGSVAAGRARGVVGAYLPIVVAAALQHGLSPRRVRELREMFGASERTLRRWREWWLERFPRSACWTASRGCFATPVDEARLPASLLERFGGDERASLLACLRFLRPASIGSFQAEQAS